MDETDPENVEFNTILEMARDEKMDKEKWQVLIDTCSMFKMSIFKFESKEFDDGRVSCLFIDSKQAKNYNKLELIKLQTNNACKASYITAVNSVGAHRFTNR